MLAGIARFETRCTSERIKRQKQQRAANGRWHGGTPPYGYQLDETTRTLVPNAAEVARIEDASSRMLDFREPMHSIVKGWNESGITTRGGHHWRQSNLRSIDRLVEHFNERERAGRVFVAGIMTEADAKREVDRVDAELESVQSPINDLLGRSTLPDVLAEDIDCQAETPGVRRSFLRLFIDRVEVSEWPEGVSRNPIRKRDESDEAYAARQREHRTEALDKRVRIVWKWL